MKVEAKSTTDSYWCKLSAQRGADRLATYKAPPPVRTTEPQQVPWRQAQPMAPPTKKSRATPPWHSPEIESTLGQTSSAESSGAAPAPWRRSTRGERETQVGPTSSAS
jgi:hypothetical protein